MLELSGALPLWQLVLLAGVSLLVGVLGGFVGLALGTMRLPALLIIGLPPTTAAGTNILVSTLSALVGGYRHIRERRVSWRVVALMGGPAVVGSFVGGFASSSSVPEGALITVAGLFVSWQAVEFAMRLRRALRQAQGEWGSAHGGGTACHASTYLFTPRRVAIEVAAGLAVGLVGGAVGLILGSVRLPLIIRVLHVHPRIAVGSNLAIGSFMGAFGFIGHGVQGEVDLPLLIAMGLPGMAGAYIGAKLTGRASLNALMLTMSAVLLVVGALLIWDGVTRWLE